jgi:hypothetical protein
MNVTRNGKIARLPKAVRDELNRRLSDGQPGKELVAWLNGLPEVQSVVAAEFDGRPVREQNLSEWKQGGYGDWLRQQEALELVRCLSAEADELTQAATEPLTDKLAPWVVARYCMAARALATENGEVGWKLLRELGSDVVALRRGDHYAERLRIERERLEMDRQLLKEKQEQFLIEWARKPENEAKIRASRLAEEERAACTREIDALEILNSAEADDFKTEQLGKAIFGDLWDKKPKPAAEAGTQADAEPNGGAVDHAPDQPQSN